MPSTLLSIPFLFSLLFQESVLSQLSNMKKKKEKKNSGKYLGSQLSEAYKNIVIEFLFAFFFKKKN